LTSFFLNRKSVTVDDDPSTPLLWVIRDSLGLTGTKFGCGMALCGACTVHLDGNDSHVHLQNVKRGKDGQGVYGMRCNTCHQTPNLPGEHMPPGNPKWLLPSPEHKMVFLGRSPAQLCRRLNDFKATGGRSLQQLLEHVSSEDLVGWAWVPGTGRTPPPLSRGETIVQMKIWIEGGGACPQ
jgi:hypothetical protein